MKGSLVPYFLLFACICTILILCIVKDERNSKVVEVKPENEVLMGAQLLTEYKNRCMDENSVYRFIIHNVDGGEIKTTSYEEFEYYIYNATNYEVVKYNEGNLIIWDLYIESYDRLLNNLSKKESYDKDKLKAYYLKDVELTPTKDDKKIIPSDTISFEEVKNNFKGHEQEIVSGKIYFRVNNEGEVQSFKYLVDLEDSFTDLEYLRFKKEYELNANGVLKGYTFVVVNE